ncbi:MAG: TetR/AcrR family transcriptional regulator [Oscillospiraceae bacterium]|nr:TetR/AcrR family transcriptional regulator [Oscillospiraceae bacterium]
MLQSEKTEITKRKILAAAEAEFSANGFAATKVDDIARRAGVNKQLIYAHYASKENLYSTILALVYGHYAEYETVLFESEYEGIETLHNVILQYFDFLTKNRSFVNLVLWENLNNASYMDKVDIQLFAGIKKLLCDGIKKGMISEKLDVEQVAHSFNVFCFSAFSNIHTISRLTHKNLDTEDELKKRAEHIADVLTKYIANADK